MPRTTAQYTRSYEQAYEAGFGPVLKPTPQAQDPVLSLAPLAALNVEVRSMRLAVHAVAVTIGLFGNTDRRGIRESAIDRGSLNVSRTREV